jgi:hypothetical protein
MKGGIMTVEEDYIGFIKFDKVVQFHTRFNRKLAVAVSYTDSPKFVYSSIYMGYMQNGHFNGAYNSDEIIDYIKTQMEGNEIFMAVYNAYKQYDKDNQGIFHISDNESRCIAYTAARKFWDTCKPYCETPVNFKYTEYVDDVYTIHCTYDKYSNIPRVHVSNKVGEQWLIGTLYPNETDLEKLKQMAYTKIKKEN